MDIRERVKIALYVLYFIAGFVAFAVYVDFLVDRQNQPDGVPVSEWPT